MLQQTMRTLMRQCVCVCVCLSTDPHAQAAGSSLLAKLTTHLAHDALRVAGVCDIAHASVLPVATGMAMTLCLLAIKAKRCVGGGMVCVMSVCVISDVSVHCCYCVHALRVRMTVVYMCCWRTAQRRVCACVCVYVCVCVCVQASLSHHSHLVTCGSEDMP